jgi:hypothetical protein
MLTSSPREVVELLQGQSLIHRTGIWMMSADMLGHESDYAARLNIDAIDIRQPLIESLPEGTRYLGLNSAKIMQLLDQICEHFRGTSCILIYNFDLLLARLRQQDRLYIWNQLYNTFPHRRHALIVVMPYSAEQLLPPSTTLKLWNSDKRLAATNVLDF